MLSRARQTVAHLLAFFRSAAERLTGYQLLKSPVRSLSLATPLAERNALGLRGLLPAGHVPLDVQVETAMAHLRTLPTDMLKYSYLQTLQDGSEALYYAALIQHTKECMPLVYTPTVGQACIDWHRIYRHTPRGIYVSSSDTGNVIDALRNWPEKGIKVIVVTDGERILGLGDLGTNGMGIPVGKLALYAACGGIPPSACLPVHIDVGTNNKKLLDDPAYMGLRQPRPEKGSKAYDDLIEEFMTAAQRLYGRTVLIQFEDFGNQNAFRVLRNHRESATCFNDDIQGTASVALAGVIASEALTKTPLNKHTFLFYGAGEAGAGIADLIAEAVAAEDKTVTVAQARESVFMMDSKGLITSKRTSLEHHKLNYAHEVAECATLLECVKALKPSALIGVAAMPGAFTKEVVEAMAEINKTPVIFALSNPTSKAECLAKDAYEWTGGRVVFASGSPMEGATINGKVLEPGQGNNAYIFPGVGLAAMASGATSIDEGAFLVAAKALATQVGAGSLAKGTVYPPLDNIREVSLQIAVAVTRHFYAQGTATLTEPKDVEKHIRSLMFDPRS
mmetsp:Transcript_9375/g.22999  ORF Transcript_9375/g.22999 Transcript_9375/m.22999 type:complete len:563 (-) Transcript_9375:64-1752(-)